MTKRIIALALSVIATFFAFAGPALALTITNVPVPGQLGQHHREFIVTSAPNEIAYLPLPAANVPIRVEVVILQINNTYSPALFSFMVTDLTLTGGLFSAPIMTGLYGKINGIEQNPLTSPICSDPNFIAVTDVALAYVISGGTGYCGFTPDPTNPPGYTNAVVIGVTNSTPAQVARVLMGTINPGPNDMNPITFRIHFWY